jgi:hypothetical protein
MEAVSGWRLAVSKRMTPAASPVVLPLGQTRTSCQPLFSGQPLTANR